MEKTNWTYILTLFSVTLGWLLNELGQWFRTRREDRKVKKQILYNLLETNFIFNQLDTSEIINLLSESILNRIPEHEQTEDNKQFLNQLYASLIGGIVQDNVADNLSEIEEKYSKAVDNLAAIDPITAYRLSGKTKVIQSFDLFKDYYEEVKKHYPDDTDEMQTQLEQIVETIKPEIIKEAISNLEDEIHGIALSLDIWTWLKVKRTLKASKERLKKEGKKKIDDLLDKVLPNSSQ